MWRRVFLERGQQGLKRRRGDPAERELLRTRAKLGEKDRWAALEPVRQGVRAHMAGYAPRIALGLGLRHDWGPQYTAHQFQAELRWLGIRSTAAYVGEPECNGVAERFIRTLKEECLYLHDFESLETARHEIGQFIECLQPRVAPSPHFSYGGGKRFWGGGNGVVDRWSMLMEG